MKNNVKKSNVKKCYVNAAEISLGDGRSVTISYEPLDRCRESNRVIVTNEKGEVRIQAFSHSRFLLEMGCKK